MYRQLREEEDEEKEEQCLSLHIGGLQNIQ